MTLIIVVGVAVITFIMLGLLAILCGLTKKDNVAQVVPLTSERTEINTERTGPSNFPDLQEEIENIETEVQVADQGK